MARVTSEEKKQAIRERRWKVWRLRVVQKLDISEIVTAVGVSASTVEADLAAMRSDRVEHFRRSQAAQDTALQAGIEVVEECEAARRQAWADLLAADRGSATRAKFLAVLLQALTKHIEILQSLGLLERVPEEVIFDESGRERDLTDEEADRLLSLLRGAGRELARGPGAADRTTRKPKAAAKRPK